MCIRDRVCIGAARHGSLFLPQIGGTLPEHALAAVETAFTARRSGAEKFPRLFSLLFTGRRWALAAAAGITSVSYTHLSADGESWTSAGEGVKSGEGSVGEYTLTLDNAVNATYVKAEMTCGSGTWIFVSELEVFGTAGTGTTDESKSETESKTESEAVSSCLLYTSRCV